MAVLASVLGFVHPASRYERPANRVPEQGTYTPSVHAHVRRTRACCTNVTIIDRMKNSNSKLVLGLALLAIGLILMCIGIRWLYFLGLGIGVVSGSLSLRPRSRVGRLRRLFVWFSQIAAFLFIVWLSSLGREPLAWSTATVVMVAVGMTEFENWRANRKATLGA
jgi:hypothetical protein